MICEIAPAMTLYPSVAHLQVYQEPYEGSLFPNSDYYMRREIESLLYDRQNSFYPRAQNMRGAAHPVMIAAATRRLTDLYRREQAREIELQAKRRLWHLYNMFSEIDATLCEKRRPYRDGTFVEYGHSLYEPTFVPLVETRYVEDPIHGTRYLSSRSSVSGKEKRTVGQKRHQNRVQTKVACEAKQLEVDEKVNERDAESETKYERHSEEHQQKVTTDLESPAPESSAPEPKPKPKPKPKPSKSVEKLESEQISQHTLPKLDQSIQQRDTTEKTKTTDMESTQNNKTKKKKEAGSGQESKMCSPPKKAISNNISCDISRCPSIEEVEDEEFKV